jgi:hypothetical protein
MAQGTEGITVPAETFRARQLGIDAGSGDGEVSYDWWISEEVRGTGAIGHVRMAQR